MRTDSLHHIVNRGPGARAQHQHTAQTLVGNLAAQRNTMGIRSHLDVNARAHQRKASGEHRRQSDHLREAAKGAEQLPQQQR